jgi:hypothetical protein
MTPAPDDPPEDPPDPAAVVVADAVEELALTFPAASTACTRYL